MKEGYVCWISGPSGLLCFLHCVYNYYRQKPVRHSNKSLAFWYTRSEVFWDSEWHFSEILGFNLSFVWSWWHRRHDSAALSGLRILKPISLMRITTLNISDKGTKLWSEFSCIKKLWFLGYHAKFWNFEIRVLIKTIKALSSARSIILHSFDNVVQ